MSTTPNLAHARWVASSYSGNGGGHCLIVAPDVATATGTVPLRDSKSPAAGTLLVPHAEWARFVRHITA
ncbi:DUF397 domain-containing protein [Streptomyces sp. LE64]|uniref:DUF397 domain-containing protein n=1 Tax=Streptomyces sp. LE64 TaxID=3448653 RepID=UPI0040414D55